MTFTATLPADATGTVTFDDGATTLGTRNISGGVATLLTISLTAGTHSITAQYGGDGNYNGAVSPPLSQVGNLATPPITLTSSPNPSTVGTSVNFRAALPTDATGTVTFLDGATVLGTGTIDFGVATLATSSLTGGIALDNGAIWRGFQLQRRCINRSALRGRKLGVQHCHPRLFAEPIDVWCQRDSYGYGHARSNRSGHLPRWHNVPRHRND